MFTAGLGAFFWLKPGRTKADLSKYLFARGLWLIFLELVVLRFAVFFRLDFGPVLLTVLWGLGLAMLALSILVHLPTKFLVAFSVAAIALHNLADPLKLTGPTQILHQLGFFEIGGVGFVSVYPLVPWFAVMALGYAAAPIIGDRSKLIKIGAALCVAFLLIRTMNIYGDPNRWDGTLLSFLKCAKYPPSLDYLLMTLGPALLILAFSTTKNFPSSNSTAASTFSGTPPPHSAAQPTYTPRATATHSHRPMQSGSPSSSSCTRSAAFTTGAASAHPFRNRKNSCGSRVKPGYARSVFPSASKIT